MIFSLFPRVVIKLGDERHVFDRATLMFTEVQEIERVTKLSYAEWNHELGRFSITAVAALVHVLRKRAGVPSDFAAIQFPAADLDVLPLHDDDSEYTAEEVTGDVLLRLAGAQPDGAGPTRAADAPGSPSTGTASTPPRHTSPSSPSGSGSAPGNGSGSPGRTGSSSRRALTQS